MSLTEYPRNALASGPSLSDYAPRRRPPEPVPPPERDLIAEISSTIRSLTYGEMIELAAGLWLVKGDGEINGDTLPAILHRWAMGHGWGEANDD